jgi:DNA repair and recombination protein RAD52
MSTREGGYGGVPITPHSSSSFPSNRFGDVNSNEEVRITNESEEATLQDISQRRGFQNASSSSQPSFGVQLVLNPDGTPLLDHDNKTISVAKMLATKPLKAELATRKGPGGKNLTYLSGDSVTRTLNDVFGFDGWSLTVKETRKESVEKDERGRYVVCYTATVRVTHLQSGAFKEDCGAGDSVDRSLATAISHALKAAITDGMKRAARLFGDKLGNVLYDGSFSVNKAPRTLKEALTAHDIDRAKSKFGFDKDRKPAAPTSMPSNQEHGKQPTDAQDQRQQMKSNSHATDKKSMAAGGQQPVQMKRSPDAQVPKVNPVVSTPMMHSSTPSILRQEPSYTTITANHARSNHAAKSVTISSTNHLTSSTPSYSGPQTKNPLPLTVSTNVSNSRPTPISTTNSFDKSPRFQNQIVMPASNNSKGMSHNAISGSNRAVHTYQHGSTSIQPRQQQHSSHVSALTDITYSNNSNVHASSAPSGNNVNGKRPLENDIRTNTVVTKKMNPYSGSNPYNMGKK